jgi:hypothetical protein
MAEAAPPDPSSTSTYQIRSLHADSPSAGKHPRDLPAAARSDAMRALARRRWDKARTAETSHAPDLAQDVPTDGSSAVDRAVVARLEQAAKKGDVAAARELREWRRLDPAQGAGHDALRLAQLIGELSTEQRQALLGWLLDALRGQDRPPQASNREGSVEANDSLPEGLSASTIAR